MSISIDIVPLAESIDMYGMPDTLSAYSLSGHVSISIKSPYSLFERRSTTRLLLQSLELTFEGQTEVLNPKVGYSAVRLCSFSRELVTGGPVGLSNEGDEDSTDDCVWNVVFNLPIPGWLPETTCIGIPDLGVRYALHANAKFTVSNDCHASFPWAFATLCTPFRSRIRYARAQKRICLRRFAEPPSDVPFNPATTSYMIKTSPLVSKSSIPIEILEKIQVVVAVPEFVDIQASILPVVLRLRTSGLDSVHCKRLQVKEIAVDIAQKEKYRSSASASYLEAYPVPPRDRQPPNEPLLTPHPVGNVYEYGLAISPAKPLDASIRAISFLPPGESGRHCFGKDNYAFTDDSVPNDNPDWYTIEVSLPFASQQTIVDASDWCTEPVELLPSMRTPLFQIAHEVTLRVTLSYDDDANRNRFHDRLTMKVPVTMVNVLPPMPSQRELHSVSPSPVPHEASGMNPYPLPAYSQLYDEEGDRKIDYSVPLPLYAPPNINEESETNVKITKPSLQPHSIDL
ncbi:hypothetical protein APHAL10511_000996 [Amanita phalloides]|nr:hypothetical protein APHAL10511_000996 [Amanita phalloides]